MDPRDFDRLARTLDEGQSRRRALRALAGGALGLAAASLGFDKTSAAAKRSVGNACRLNGDCASGLCQRQGPSRAICACSATSEGATCPGGVCHEQACCAPDAKATTCGTLCGPQTNNCGQSVECGACCIPNGGYCDITNFLECCSKACLISSDNVPINQCFAIV